MKKVVVFGGYARSGKTTTGEILQSFGYKKVSTSDALHAVTRRFFKEILNVDIDTYNKAPFSLKLISKFTDTDSKARVSYWTAMRPILIAVAEKVLVPIFGRAVFSYYAASHVMKHYYNQEHVFFETIGGAEFELFEQFMDDTIEITYLNIRRDSEEPDADYRQLLPAAKTIDNNGTEYDLRLLLREVLD